MTKRLILPVEIKSREFDANLLLAGALALDGWEVVVGSRWEINRSLYREPPSLYLAKDITNRSLDFFQLLRAWGHQVVALDEEALVVYRPESYIHRRVGRETARAAVALLAWGEENAKTWRDALDADAPTIFTVGNPRIDLLRQELRPSFDARIAELREDHGRYILVNSNFGSVNTVVSELKRLPHPEDVERGKVEPPPNYSKELALYRHSCFQAFLTLIPILASRFPDITIVVRPHPSEDPKAWERAAAGLDNVRVIYRGEVVPWILGAEAVLHHSCTTAVEATVGRIPVVSYSPEDGREWEPQLPAALSVRARSPDAVCDLIGSALQGTFPWPADDPYRTVLDRHVASNKGALAVDAYTECLGATYLQCDEVGRRTFWGHWKALRKRWRSFRDDVKKRSPWKEKWMRYTFPDTDLNEVRERVADLTRSRAAFAGLSVEQTAKNIFTVRQAQRGVRRED